MALPHPASAVQGPEVKAWGPVRQEVGLEAGWEISWNRPGNRGGGLEAEKSCDEIDFSGQLLIVENGAGMG